MRNAENRQVGKRVEPMSLRKRYITPRLINHGDVEGITRSLGGSGSDGQAGSQLGDEQV